MNSVWGNVLHFVFCSVFAEGKDNQKSTQIALVKMQASNMASAKACLVPFLHGRIK